MEYILLFYFLLIVITLALVPWAHKCQRDRIALNRALNHGGGFSTKDCKSGLLGGRSYCFDFKSVLDFLMIFGLALNVGLACSTIVLVLMFNDLSIDRVSYLAAIAAILGFGAFLGVVFWRLSKAIWK